MSFKEGCLVALVGFSLAVGCTKERGEVKQAQRTVTAFMGHPVLALPEGLKEEKLFVDKFPYKTKTVVLAESDQQNIYAQYLDEEVAGFPSGTFLKAYVVIGRPVFSDAVALKQYLTSFQEKYGTFDAESGWVSLCDNKGNCRELVTHFDGAKRFNSETLWMAERIRNAGPTTVHEVSVFDRKVLDAIVRDSEAKSSEGAKALVK